MEAYDFQGNRREASGEEVHTYDQMTKRFADLTLELTAIQACAQQAALAAGPGSPDELAALHEQVKGSLMGLINEGPPITASYIMYLINLVCVQEQETVQRANLAKALFAGMSLLLPEDHHLYGMGATPDNIHELLHEAFPTYATSRFTTGTGQNLHNVHSAETCHGPFCVIHKPCPGPWEGWATRWCGDGPMDIWRGFERICPCGVGHPAVEEIMLGNQLPGPHDCCGVCRCSMDDCTARYDEHGELLGFE